MDDRIAEIRKALPIAERTVGPVNDAIVSVFDAARAYADLLESLQEETAKAYWAGFTAKERKAMPANLRRLVTEWEPIDVASSQGVEP